MAAVGLYKIGSLTLSLVATITGGIGTSVSGSGTAEVTAGGQSSGQIFSGIGSGSWFVGVTDSVNIGPGGPPGVFQNTSREVSVGVFGASDTQSYDESLVDGDASGTFEVECQCDICLLITHPTSGSGRYAQFALGIEDTPPNTDVAIVLIPTPDQDVTATLTIGGTTATATGNTGPTPSTLGYQVILEPYAECTVQVDQITFEPFFTSEGTATANADTSIEYEYSLPLSTFAGLTTEASNAGPGNASSASTSSDIGVATVNTDATATASGEDLAGAGCHAEGTAGRTEYGDRGVVLQGEVRRVSKIFLGGAELVPDLTANISGFATSTIVDFPGQFDARVTQKNCSQSASCEARDSITTNSDSDSSSINTYAGVGANLTEASLVALGEDPLARRLLIRGKQSNTIASLKQRDGVQIDNCTAIDVPTGDWAGDWSISGAGTLTFPLEGIVPVLEFEGAGETLTRTFDTPSYLANYRFLQFRIKATEASQVLQVEINGKQWNITTSETPDEYLYVAIDLCMPLNATETQDSTDTRWPEDEDGRPQEGPYFGVGTTLDIAITGMVEDVAYRLEDIGLVLTIFVNEFGNPLYYHDINIYPSLGYFVKEQPDSEVAPIVGSYTEYFTTRFFHSAVMNMGQTIDEPALKMQVFHGGSSGIDIYTYTHVTIADLWAQLSSRKYPGMVAVEDTPAPTPSGEAHPPANNEYYNTDLYAVYLWGAGMIAVPTMPGQTEWFLNYAESDLPFEDFASFQAQPLYDTISEWFPGTGDIFGYAGDQVGVEGALFLRCGTVLGGYARGLVADEDHVCLGDVDVTLTQASVDRGSDTSRTAEHLKGAFATDTPYSQVGAATLSTDDESFDFTAFTRKRQRGVFIAPSDTPPGIELLNPPLYWVALATSEDGEIRWRRWERPVPMASSPIADLIVTSGHTDKQPALCYPGARRVILLFWRKDEDGVFESYSDDDGDTWSTPEMSIPNGQYPRICEDISGGILRTAWIQDVGSIGFIKGSWQAAGDTVPSALFTLSELGGSDLRVKRTGYDISPSSDSASRLNLACIIESETDTSHWYSEDDGRTWTRVV